MGNLSNLDLGFWIWDWKEQRTKGSTHSVKGKQVSGVGFQVSGMNCGIRNELIANWKA